jgi:uncharacterized membrane protein
MGLNGGLYKFLLVLHIVAAIVGFGGSFLAGMLGLEAKKRGGTDALAITRSTLAVTERVSLMAIYAVPVLGILLILTSDDVWKFSQAWISLSFLLYIAAVGLYHAVHRPNLHRMNVLMGNVSSGGAGREGLTELQERGKKAGAVGGILNLIWVAIVFLMVFKPGV